MTPEEIQRGRPLIVMLEPGDLIAFRGMKGTGNMATMVVTMTAKRAKEIIRRVWGGQSLLTEAEWLECRQGGAPNGANLTLLEWLQGVAGDSAWNWRQHGGAFSQENIQHFANL